MAFYRLYSCMQAVQTNKQTNKQLSSISQCKRIESENSLHESAQGLSLPTYLPSAIYTLSCDLSTKIPHGYAYCWSSRQGNHFIPDRQIVARNSPCVHGRSMAAACPNASTMLSLAGGPSPSKHCCYLGLCPHTFSKAFTYSLVPAVAAGMWTTCTCTCPCMH